MGCKVQLQKYDCNELFHSKVIQPKYTTLCFAFRRPPLLCMYSNKCLALLISQVIWNFKNHADKKDSKNLHENCAGVPVALL